MKLPRGFRKNYFSLNAIVATVNGVSLQKNEVRIKSSHRHAVLYAEEEQESSLEKLDPFVVSAEVLKPCHCNCYFFSVACRALKLYTFSTKSLTYYYYHIFSSISPPFNKL